MTTTRTELTNADLSFWEGLARLKTHPTQIAILDALRPGGQLSPVQFAKGRKDMDVGHAGYHFRSLKADGLVRLVGQRPVRGAVEHFYAFDGDEATASKAVAE